MSCAPTLDLIEHLTRAHFPAGLDAQGGGVLQGYLFRAVLLQNVAELLQLDAKASRASNKGKLGDLKAGRELTV